MTTNLAVWAALLSFASLQQRQAVTVTAFCSVCSPPTFGSYYRPPAFLRPSLSTTTTRAMASSADYDFALLFDCDGVILETEELHRRAYNAAFKEFELSIDGEPVEWSVEYYDFLQNTVAGGKPKMFFHFRNTTKAFPASKSSAAPPATAEEELALIESIQTYKTGEYKRLVREESQTRPGVLDLMDEAINDPNIAVGVCSASTKEAAIETLGVTLGEERVNKLDVTILGDDVSRKKPDPMIYDEARKRLGGLTADRCVVIEDSLVGLRAAKSANMKCLITYTPSTAPCDFYGQGADAKVPDLASRKVTLDAIFGPLKAGDGKEEMLAGIKDPIEVPV